ncbi:Xaa-Pro aminopeptidase [Parelusimicrobium proximum]|uniref:M24 family metallopeptidase n=1 Tax=Parelusimicrobium proximum TaxID=3228953 RepID=UPI003D170D5E
MSVKSKKDYASKMIKRFQSELKKKGLEGYVVTNHVEQYYLTDFHLYAGESVMLISSKGVFFIGREMYINEIKTEFPFITPSTAPNYVKAAVKLIKKLKLKKIGFDGTKASYTEGKELAKVCKDVPGIINAMRMVKTEDEIEKMKATCKVAYEAFDKLKPRIKTGMTEVEVAAELEKLMRTAGAFGTSFDTIVAFGEGSAEPHHKTGLRKLKNEEAITIDFGCIVNGYCSDITRSWWHGKKPSAEYTKIWNLVDKARSTAIKTAKPGMKAKDIDAIARNIIAKEGYGEYFTHGTGHSLGLEIHEAPNLNTLNETKVVKNMFETVEPGIYLHGKFGVRLEDTCLMTAKGFEMVTRPNKK